MTDLFSVAVMAAVALARSTAHEDHPIRAARFTAHVVPASEVSPILWPRSLAVNVTVDHMYRFPLDDRP